MKLLRKATATVALLALVSGYFSVGVNAYSTAQLEAANALAAEGIIVTQDDAAGYALDQQVLRQEIAAVARWVAGLEKTTVCNNVFADVSKMVPNNWACYSIEALYNEGLIASNDTFRPEANISKAEAVGMMVKAAYGSEYEYNDALSTTWQEQVVAFAVEKGIISSFSNYDTAATRGFVFEVGANAMDDEEDEEDLLGELLGELLGGDDEDMDDEDTTTEDDEDMDDEDTTVTISGDDVLEITLSPTTPDEATIPGAINGLPVAKFDFTAGNEDVTITSIVVKRKGLSDDATLTSLAVFTDEGRVSKGKNDSEENKTQATLNLNSGWVTVMAGETMTFSIVVDVAASATANWDEFAIQLLDVNASSEVEGLDNLVANTMKVGGVDAAGLTVNTNGSVSNPNLGDDEVEIFKFKLENGSDYDIITHSITFKWDGSIDEEDELSNFQLVDNEGNVVAETAYSNGKYLTFNIDGGFVVTENKTEKFKVLADIDGGASKTIKFYVDKNLDVTAEDTQYGYGASVTITNVDASWDLGTLTVQAGELTLIDIDPATTTIREDKKDIDLGKIKIVNNAWGDLEIQKFGVKIDITNAWGATATKIADVLDNIELYDETNGTTYDLATVNDGTDNSLTEAFQDADLNISVPAGEMVLAIRADTVNSITNFDQLKIATSVKSWDLTAAGWLYIVEIEDDQVVSDITPDSLSFKSIDGAESSATVTVLPMSTTKSAVIGSEDIEALEFEVEADESSDLRVTEIVVDGSAATATFDKTLVSQVKLYRESVSESNLVKSTSDISSEKVTFDSLDEDVEANNKVKFIVTVSLVDDATNATDDIKLALDSDTTNIRVSMEDEDADDVVFAGVADLASARVITVKGVWTLTAVVDNTDTETDQESNVLGNTTSSYVASYELTANNEDVKLEKVVITADETTNPVWFESAVSEIVLFDEDGDEIGRESVTSDVTTFDTFDYVVEEWSENIYVKVITRKIGKDAAGQFNDIGYKLELTVTEAEWDESGKDVVVTSINSDGQVGDSKVFAVVPVRVSAISFVDSYGWEEVADNLTNGENTVAIIAVTTDSSSNTNSTDGSSLKTELENMELTFATDATTYDTGTDIVNGDITALTVERIDGTTSAQTVAKSDGTALADNDNLNTTGINLFKGVALGSDEEIDNSTTAYYVVKATFSGLSSTLNKYVQLKLENLDTASNVEYSSDDSDDNETYSATDNILKLRLGTTSISGPSISSNY